jgi:hypothetical protein
MVTSTTHEECGSYRQGTNGWPARVRPPPILPDETKPRYGTLADTWFEYALSFPLALTAVTT